MSYSTINSRGQTYYLHGKDVVLKNGREQRIYFFAKQRKDKGALDAIPDGMEITENKQTGLPVLRRIRQPV
ncbi:MAG TPA: hypothetical protein QGF05_10360 [Dehalococcoidia bacterium]|nr:hypothetical protein [Dehalococcoidia bacterium]